MGANLAAQDQKHSFAWLTEGREEGNTATTAASIAQKHHFHSAGMHAPVCAAIDHSPHDEFNAYDVLPLVSQIMCSPFWPNESIHSIEYGQLVVTFVSTTPKPDWEMTVLQVADKNRVSSAEVLYSMYVSIFLSQSGKK